MIFKCPICKTETSHKGVCYNCQMTRKDEYLLHLKKLEKKREYRQGDVITTIDELKIASLCIGMIKYIIEPLYKIYN